MPCLNEVWLLSVDEWNDDARVDEEEYYGVVERVDFTKYPAEYTVQDLEQSAGPEVVLQNRQTLNVFVCLAIV